MEAVLNAVLADASVSPLLYLVVALLAAIDGFFPLVPSETVVIAAGAFAAAGQPNLVLLVLVTAAGAYAGDNVAYLIGRSANRRMGERLWRSARRRQAYERAALALRRRGGLIIVAARYLPGGRTVTMLTAGAVGYDRRRFQVFAAVAAVAWATYAALLGYLGGAVFRGHPVRGALIGLGTAFVLAGLVEAVRWLVRRVRLRRTPGMITVCNSFPTSHDPQAVRSTKPSR